MALSIEERYDEVRQLIQVGKEKGYLLYDEVNEMLPSEITSSEDLDDLFNAFGSAGIEVVDSDKAYRGEKDFDRDGSEEGPELDLTPGALDKTNDPVRMYLREMGTVPLLTREGEVAIAKRIERGKLAVIKSISRTPLISKKVIELGDQLHTGERTIRELVIFNDEEITDERIIERSKQVQKQIEARAQQTGTSVEQQTIALVSEKQPSHKFSTPEQIGGLTVFMMPLLHQAAALRTPSLAETLREDFAKLPGLLGQDRTAHSGQDHVGNERIDRTSVFGEHPQRDLGPARGHDGGALALEPGGDGRTDQFAVLDDEYGRAGQSR